MCSKHFVRLARGVSAAVLVIGVVFAWSVKTQAAIDECTWTGAVSGAWNTTGNWQCDVDGVAVPENGDTLIFPEDAANKSTNNDISGLEAGMVVIDGDDYTLGGNGLSFDTLRLNGNDNTISLDLTAWAEIATTGTGNVLNDVVATQEGIFTISPAGGLTIDGVISGATGSFQVTDSGTLTINEEATFTADEVQLMNSVVVTCNVDACLGDAQNPVVTFDSGRIDFGEDVDFDNSIELRNSAGATAISTVADGDDGTAFLNGDITVTESAAVEPRDGMVMYVYGEVSIAADKTLTYKGSLVLQDGPITGAGNLVLEAFRVYLRAENTYTGATTIKSDVWISDEGNLGATSTGTVVESGGVIMTISILGDKEYAEPLTLTGHGPTDFEGAITNADSGDDITFSGPITLDGDTTIHNVFNNSTLIISGPISGTGNLTIGASEGNDAPYVLGDPQAFGNGSPNTFDGDLIIHGSAVTVAQDWLIPGNLLVRATEHNNASVGNLATGALDLIADDAIVTLTKNGEHTATLSYGGMDNQETIGGLSGDGTVNMQDNIDIQTLTLNVSGNPIFTGDLTTNILNKLGTGTQTLSGEVNVDTINISNGNLVITGDTTASFVVNEGSTLKGNGQIGNATVAGTLAPGMSPGIITVDGDLDLTNGSLDVELDGTTVGTRYDQTVVTGTATLSNSTLNVIPGFTPAVGDSFTFLRADTIDGAFAGLANDAVFTVGNISFRINYNLAQAGEDSVTLTVVSITSGNLASTGDGQTILVAISLGLLATAVIALILGRPLTIRDAARRLG